jgi:hypothetical protein
MRINPELLRNLRLQLSPRRALSAAGLTLTLIIVGTILIWFGTNSYYSINSVRHLKEFGSASFWMLFFAQFALLIVLGATATGGSIIQERVRGTIIFQQMSLLSPHEFIMGKLFGVTSMCYYLTLLILPFALFAAFLGEFTLEDVIALYSMLFACGICWQMIGLFISATIAKGVGESGKNIVGIGYSVGGLATIVTLYCYGTFWDGRKIFFYGFELSHSIIAIGLMLFISIWAYVGAVRAFKDLQLIKLSTAPIWYFFASLEAMLVGLFWKGHFFSYSGGYYYKSLGMEHILAYLGINWMAITFLAGSSAINRDQLREWWSVERDANSILKRSELRNAVITYPIAIAIALIGLTALWLSFGFYFLDVECNQYYVDYNYYIPFYVFVIAAITFLFRMAGMAGFIQFWSMHRFKAARWVGVTLWGVLFLVLGIGAVIISKWAVLSLINPSAILLFRDCSDSFSRMDAPTVILEILTVEAVIATGFILLAYFKWRRTYREMVS